MTPNGVSLDHTSEPRDARLALDPVAAEHLVVGAADDLAVARLAEQGRLLGVHPEMLLLGEQAPDVPGLLAALRRRLGQASVGLRVYVTGPEALVRAACHAGREAGLTDEELIAGVTGGRARRVWCVHCRTLSEGVATSTTPCAGCGRTLLVYHHFSRRRNAYLGFQADAEVPGELPDPVAV